MLNISTRYSNNNFPRIVSNIIVLSNTKLQTKQGNKPRSRPSAPLQSDSLFAYGRVSTQAHRCIGFHDDAFKSSAFDVGPRKLRRSQEIEVTSRIQRTNNAL